jgi:hypothetical protein
VLSSAPAIAGRWLSLHAWLITLALAIVVLSIGLHGGDLAAQDYRVWAFRNHGFLLWDVNWYGGNSDVGYSVLFPAVGTILGASGAAACACVISTFLFGRLVGGGSSRAAALCRIWFAAFSVGDLVVGRAPFECSVACALGAVLAVVRARPKTAAAASVAASLFSPLGGMFLLLIGAAWLRTLGWRRALPLAGAFSGIAVSVASGTGGLFPFTRAELVIQLAIAGTGLLLTPRSYLAIRRGLALYGIACIGFFVVPNPVGGNVIRLAGLIVGPLAAYVLLSARHGRILVVLAGPMLAFQLLPVVTSAAYATDDPSSQPSYYNRVLPFLEAHDLPLSRVEIPFTRDHWEATFVAEQVDLARGWDRQTDLERNAILYTPLTATTYRSWLTENAVRFVALPDVPLDAGGAAEAALLAHPPRWLHLVFHDDHWKVWQVGTPGPFAEGVGTVTQLAPDGFTLTASRPGQTLVRVRWSPYWHVDEGQACVDKTPGGWTIVNSLVAGSVQISARLSLDDDACPAPISPDT